MDALCFFAGCSLVFKTAKRLFYANITPLCVPFLSVLLHFLVINFLVFALRIWNIINKASKFFGAYVVETQTAQPRGKLTVICPFMLFPHPLQNSVPRVRILLPLPQIWPGIPWNPGLFSCFGAVGCGLSSRSLWRVFCAFFASGRIRF